MKREWKIGDKFKFNKTDSTREIFWGLTGEITELNGVYFKADLDKVPEGYSDKGGYSGIIHNISPVTKLDKILD